MLCCAALQSSNPRLTFVVAAFEMLIDDKRAVPETKEHLRRMHSERNSTVMRFARDLCESCHKVIPETCSVFARGIGIEIVMP